jgi:uncharacterized protein YndB with AHSA1/START domain
VPRLEVSRTVAAPVAKVWEVIADPHHLYRWWPGVTRIEAVSDDHFTQVMPTRKGRPMRVDFVVLASEPPRRRVWALQPEGTPFERMVALWETEVLLEPDGDGTRVSLAERQLMHGSLRLAAYLQRRSVRKRLNGALDGLEQIFG